jgi:hypothetical protein
MSERPYRDPLQDYLDELLPGEEKRAMEARLAADEDLALQLTELRSIREAAGRLPRSIEPAGDLWPDIESAITAPRRRGRRRPSGSLAFAAAALLLLASLLLWRERPGQPLVSAAGGAEIAAMERMLSGVEWELAPTLAANDFPHLDGAAGQLDRALAESLNAWKADPDSEAARRRLLKIHGQRIRFARRTLNLQARI